MAAEVPKRKEHSVTKVCHVDQQDVTVATGRLLRMLTRVWGHLLGARLRGRTATQRSKKGSEKVLGRVLGEGFSEGFREGGLLWVLQ